VSTNGTHPPDPGDDDIPEDLRILRDRLAELGVHVRLPTARGDFKLPKPIRVKGESLSETVIRMRRGDIPPLPFPEEEVAREDFQPVSKRLAELIRRNGP
jgi:hypothetical protein